MRQTNLAIRRAACEAAFSRIPPLRVAGRVAGISGLVVDIDGLAGHVSVGDRLLLEARDGRAVLAEIVGFRADLAQAMPFDALDGLGPGSPAVRAAERRRRLRRGGRLARPGARPAGPAAGRQRRPPARSRCTPVAGCRAGGHRTGAIGPAARSRRPRAQLLHHLPTGPAPRPVLRLRHRQVHLALHAGAAHRVRRRGARPGRRARPRSAGVPGGRSRRRGPGALGRRGGHLGRAAAAAPPGGLCGDDRGGAFPRPGPVGACS